jgi:hypothetical protein
VVPAFPLKQGMRTPAGGAASGLPLSKGSPSLHLINGGRETPEEKRNVWIRDRRNNRDHLRDSFHREENLRDGLKDRTSIGVSGMLSEIASARIRQKTGCMR